MGSLNFLVLINTGTLISIVLFGYRIIRFINRIEFKTDILWSDYEYRVKGIERRNNTNDNNGGR